MNDILEYRKIIDELYGTEDLCVLLYSLACMQKPKVVLEFGTGSGLISLFVGQALKENGSGSILTFDHADVSEYANLQSYLFNKTNDTTSNSYTQFISELFDKYQLTGQIKFCKIEINIENLNAIEYLMPDNTIDWVICDFSNSPEDCSKILSYFLPKMSKCSSFFFDSIPTKLLNYLAFKEVISNLNKGKLPRSMIENKLEDEINNLSRIIKELSFQIIPLNEIKQRKQNSTLWLRIHPSDYLPYPLTNFYN